MRISLTRRRRQRSDEELVRAARGGDRDALVKLIERCETSIASGLRSGGVTRADREYADAELEALATICDCFDDYDARGPVCAWMRVVARNVAVGQIRAEVRQRRIRDKLLAGRVDTVHVDDHDTHGPSAKELAETIVAR